LENFLGAASNFSVTCDDAINSTNAELVFEGDIFVFDYREDLLETLDSVLDRLASAVSEWLNSTAEAEILALVSDSSRRRLDDTTTIQDLLDAGNFNSISIESMDTFAPIPAPTAVPTLKPTEVPTPLPTETEAPTGQACRFDSDCPMGQSCEIISRKKRKLLFGYGAGICK